MSTATLDDFELDIRLDDIMPITNYPDFTQQSHCHSIDVSCYANCNTTAGKGCTGL